MLEKKAAAIFSSRPMSRSIGGGWEEAKEKTRAKRAKIYCQSFQHRNQTMKAKTEEVKTRTNIVDRNYIDWNNIRIHSDICDAGKQIAWRHFAVTLSAPYCRLRFMVEDAARSYSNETWLQFTYRDCRFDDGISKAVTGWTAHWTVSKYCASFSARVFSSWLCIA